MKRQRFMEPGVLLLALIPAPAFAHIKWFVEFDMSDAPRRMGLVLDNTFWALMLAASAALFIAYLIDIQWSSRQRFDWIGRHFGADEDVATALVRICVGVLFATLWVIGHVLLTPELTSDWEWLPHLQFVTALCVLLESTMIVSALGILVLFVRGVIEYGIHHMTDYVTFLGLAAYLGISSIGSETLKRYRLPLLMIALVFSFLWSSIEKFGYPQWFDPFLDTNQALTMGIPRHIFLMCAAFVEFTLVYLILTGGNMVVVGAVGLNLLIVAGASYFGKIDTIGHFPIIVILAIIAIKGPVAYGPLAYREGAGVLPQAGLRMLGYWSSLALMFLLYYGIHRLEYACG